MKFKEIKNNVFYCGLNDAGRVIFDELIPLECGTTYNSFLVVGSEKTALIDTMYPPFTAEYIENLKASGVNKIDYIVANHGEQDHSGSIPALLKEFPNAVVVTNQNCKNNIIEMLLVPENRIMVVKDKEELSLGDKTLKFFMTPGVHWPDTMFTLALEDNLLFTCDFLGAHLPFEELYSKCDAEHESMAKRYYAEIMMPFRMLCAKYLKLIDEINPEIILPSHGPLHNKPEYILNLYRDWTDETPKNLVLIPYVSMYKSVREMVMYLKEKLEAKGIRVQAFDVVRDDLGDIAIGMVDAATIVLGASMVLALPHPMAANVAYIANLLKPKAKFASFIGSYGWGGNLIEKLGEMLNNLKVEVITPVLVKGKAKEPDYKLLDQMADAIYKGHKKLNIC